MVDQLFVGRFGRSTCDQVADLVDQPLAGFPVGQVHVAVDRFAEQQFLGQIIALDPRLVGGGGRAADKHLIVLHHRLLDLGREDDRRLLRAFDDLIAAEQSHARDQEGK